MKSHPILIHTHFHNKRTGVTRSIENVFPFFQKDFDTYIFGYGVEGRRISLVKMLKLVFSKRSFILHCHRNNEILLALFFRLLGGNFKLISTRHAETKPSVVTEYLLKKSDHVVALTKSMSDDLSIPSVVIGHGVDQKVFKPQSLVVRKEVSQKHILSCAGRVREAKGQKLLLEVVAPLLPNHKDWALAIIGKVDDSAFLKELKAIVAEYSIEKQVYLIPETPEIVSFYQASHSVVVPSFTEGFSLVCAEAMSCACNVLASRGVGVHSEIITENKTGYLFDVENRGELEGLLSKLFKGELKHLGEAAQKEVSEKWSSKIEACNLMKLYSSSI